MFILKIVKTFIPTGISDHGELCEYMNPPYLGFIVEVLEERTWNNKTLSDSRFIGTQHTIIEKHTWDSAKLHRDDIVTISRELLTQGLCGLSWEEWMDEPRVLINNCNTPIIKLHVSGS